MAHNVRYDHAYLARMMKRIHERQHMDDEFEKAMELVMDKRSYGPNKPGAESAVSCNLENPEICESCQ